MDIVPVDETHADELASLHVKAWKKAYTGIVPKEYLDSLSIKNRKERLLQAVKDNTEKTYVGIKDKSVTGFITFGKYRNADADDQTGEICGIYLGPEHWRKGIGTELALWGLDNLKESGFTTVKIWAFEDNKRGAEFYKSLGFVPDGTVKTSEKFRELRIIRFSKEI